ncbi:MAG: alpha/beta hydrolase [Ignavibacteriaceae bacterium]|jgi:microsomal epoxide hydrolase|nr:alpha/beta hydrolase [Ignavibacteriaceae bacterium]
MESNQRRMAFIISSVFVVVFLMNNLIFAVSLSKTDTLVTVSDEVTLHVIDAGPSEAQTLVLIPGWPFAAEIWNKQITTLGDRYHIVAFDPRSQGRSTILNHSNSPDFRASDISNLIKKMNLHKPVLVGWSQGVQDVAAYVMNYGTNEISGIVLVDATVSAGAAKLDCKDAAMTFGRMPFYVSNQREYLEGMMPYIFNKQLSPSELNTIVNAALQTPNSIGLANLMLDFFGKDYRPAFKRINVPTLLIIAGIAPNKDEQMQQPIPNATTAVVEGAGHAVFYDEPAKFNELLVQFLKERVTETKR